MRKYKFEEFAVNCTKKKVPSPEEYATYIGLEHMDTKCLKISRWGSSVPIIGEKLIMHKGDVLLGKRNAYLRRAAIAPHDGVFSAHGMVLQPKIDVVDKDFFSLFIASDYFFDEAIRISVGSLSPTINWSDLKNLEFNLPDLSVQKEIAKVLWSINNTVESYKNMIIKNNDLLEAKFINTFGNPVELKSSVPVLSLSDIFYKPQSGEWGKEDKSGTGVFVLRTTNFTDEGFIDFYGTVTRSIEDKKVKSKQIKFGDILIEKSGGSTDKAVGRVVLYELNNGVYLNNNFTAVLRLNDKYNFNPYFVFYFMYVNYWLGGTKNYESKTTGIHNLNLTEFLEKTKIPIVSMEEQDEFVKFYHQIKATIEELKNGINKLEDIYKNIITNCLTNKED